MYATAQQAAILRAAVEAIKQRPETFDMSSWACGTTCCLAGQVVRNAVSDAKWQEIVAVESRRYNLPFEHSGIFPVRDRAVRILGLSDSDNGAEESLSEEDQLFYVENWPAQFRPPLNDDGVYGPVSPEQLEARVEHWIETGE